MTSLNCITCPERRELIGRAAQLNNKLNTLPVIEQAKGILIALNRISPEAAFSVLRRESNDTNTPLREVAAKLVASYAPSSAP